MSSCNATNENLAGWVARRVRLALTTEDIDLHSVTVYEGDGGGWCRLEFE